MHTYTQEKELYPPLNLIWKTVFNLVHYCLYHLYHRRLIYVDSRGVARIFQRGVQFAEILLPTPTF